VPVTITEVRSTERFVGTEDEPRQVLHVTIERSMRDGAVRLDVPARRTRVGRRRRRERAPHRAGRRPRGPRRPAAGPARGPRRSVTSCPSASAARTEDGKRGRRIRNGRRGRARLDDGHGVALPLRPRLVEHAGVLHDGLGLRRPGLVDAAGVRGQRVRARRGPPQARGARPGLPLRAGRAGLPQALLRHLPEQRAVLRGCSTRGAVELVGGTYNEPNTNLTSSETTIRNFVYGIGFQRDILGGDPDRPGSSTRSVTTRSSRPRGEGRADRERLGPRAAPPVGSAAPALGPGPHRRRHRHAVRERVRVDLAER
jgi:hypothetical protein